MDLKKTECVSYTLSEILPSSYKNIDIACYIYLLCYCAVLLRLSVNESVGRN